MKDYVKEFEQDLEEFRKVTDQFYHGEISTGEYKKISGKFGSYAQRGGKSGMLRLRLWGGRITKEHLKFIVDCIDSYQIDRIHLTTCQTVQLHNLKADTICDLAKAAWEHGIITMGGGGNYPRNVMMSPLSGVNPEETFDVAGYAKAASEYLLGFIHTMKFPRKLKVCFSNTKDDKVHAAFRDLGFLANDDNTFDVYSAGGLGRDPKLGILTAEHIAPELVLYYIKAMADTFVTYGNYKNPNKARTRFLPDAMGTEEYLKAYQKKLEHALETEDLKLSVKPFGSSKKGNGTLLHPRVIPQKQSGLYAVSFHPIGGSPRPEIFSALYQAILPMDDVEIRLSPDEGMYIINCNAKEAEILLGLTKDSAQTAFETSIACIGNHICQLGLRDSQSLLQKCIEAVRPYHFAEGVLPKIHISGCFSSCGTHQSAALGFRGAVKQSPNGPLAAYALFEGGCAVRGSAKLGNELCVITEENIPKFLIELGRRISEEQTTFKDWIAKRHEEFLELAGKYAA